MARLLDGGLEAAGRGGVGEEVVGRFDPLADVVGGTCERVGLLVVKVEPIGGKPALRAEVSPPVRVQHCTIHRRVQLSQP